jgi:hypothetical protein
MKHHAANMDAREACARHIALEAGVLKVCQQHEDEYFVTGEDIVEAYKLAASYFKDGHYKELFSSQLDFTDTIKVVVEGTMAEECTSCANRERQFDKHADPELL